MMRRLDPQAFVPVEVPYKRKQKKNKQKKSDHEDGHFFCRPG
jgi:hypothetical protein